MSHADLGGGRAEVGAIKNVARPGFSVERLCKFKQGGEHKKTVLKFRKDTETPNCNSIRRLNLPKVGRGVGLGTGEQVGGGGVGGGRAGGGGGGGEEN